MSYCVHCGVELHETSKSCPLCNTPVVNPRIPLIPDGKKPFAEKKGQVDRVRHSDMAILLSVVLGSTGLSCGILNFLFFMTASGPFILLVLVFYYGYSVFLFLFIQNSPGFYLLFLMGWLLFFTVELSPSPIQATAGS